MVYTGTMEKVSNFAMPAMLLLLVMCTKKIENVEKEIVTQRTEFYSWIPVQAKLNDAFGGYYIALPPDYYHSGKNYPMILFLHGLGQVGNGSSELRYINFDGLGKVVNEKRFPVYFAHNNEQYSFVVVSPQSSRAPSADEVKQFASYVSTTYNIDTNRMYISGLSMGARCVTLTVAKYPHLFAAAVPIAGVADGTGMEDRCKTIAAAGLPLWLFHNSDDPMSNIESAKKFIQYININNPASPAVFTEFNVYGHDAWTTALDTAFKENGRNIYEWMLQHTRK